MRTEKEMDYDPMKIEESANKVLEYCASELCLSVYETWEVITQALQESEDQVRDYEAKHEQES